jgi:hypothetical protein
LQVPALNNNKSCVRLLFSQLSQLSTFNFNESNKIICAEQLSVVCCSPFTTCSAFFLLALPSLQCAVALVRSPLSRQELVGVVQFGLTFTNQRGFQLDKKHISKKCPQSSRHLGSRLSFSPLGGFLQICCYIFLLITLLA